MALLLTYDDGCVHTHPDVQSHFCPYTYCWFFLFLTWAQALSIHQLFLFHCFPIGLLIPPTCYAWPHPGQLSMCSPFRSFPSWVYKPGTLKTQCHISMALEHLQGPGLQHSLSSSKALPFFQRINFSNLRSWKAPQAPKPQVWLFKDEYSTEKLVIVFCGCFTEVEKKLMEQQTFTQPSEQHTLPPSETPIPLLQLLQ